MKNCEKLDVDGKQIFDSNLDTVYYYNFPHVFQLAFLNLLQIGFIDLHVAQLMPLPLTVSCFSKIQSGFTFLVPAHLCSPGKRAVKRVCVC